MSASLRIADLRAGYGGGAVVNGLNVQVQHGERLAVLGRNGVGKSTLLKSIVGQAVITGGAIEIDGRSVVGLPPHKIARQGIAYVPQGRGIFPKLTVKENLALGTRAAGKGSPIDDAVFSYFPILKERLRQAAGTLSGGQQQMLALARALCSGPRMLLLDEPSEGIQPSIVKELQVLLPQIASERDLTLVIVEQNLELAAGVAARFVFLDKGQIVHECDAAGLQDREMLHRHLAV